MGRPPRFKLWLGVSGPILLDHSAWLAKTREARGIIVCWLVTWHKIHWVASPFAQSSVYALAWPTHLGEIGNLFVDWSLLCVLSSLARLAIRLPAWEWSLLLLLSVCLSLGCVIRLLGADTSWSWVVLWLGLLRIVVVVIVIITSFKYMTLFNLGF